MSKLQTAIDFYYANDCSKSAAARKFNVALSNIIQTLQKQDADVAIYNAIGLGKLAAIDAWISGNPQANLVDAAKCFHIEPSDLRAAYRGQELTSRRARLVIGQRQSLTLEEMREACAVMCETLGGDMAAIYASTIRSLPTVK